MRENIKHYPLRLPIEVHQQIQHCAEKERRSLNTMIICLLERALTHEKAGYSIIHEADANRPEWKTTKR